MMDIVAGSALGAVLSGVAVMWSSEIESWLASGGLHGQSRSSRASPAVAELTFFSFLRAVPVLVAMTSDSIHCAQLLC
jgi:hypothetical protein